MREYTAVLTDDTPDWGSVPIAPIDNLLWTERCEVTAYAQLCRTTDALRLRLRAEERNIRAEELPPLGMPCRDSCLEFFFCPEAGDDRYFNLEFSPSGCMYLGFGLNIREHSRLLVTDAGKIFCPEVSRSSGGWEVSYRVPFDFIRRFFPDFSVFPGKTMRANFYKCGDATVSPHYLAWNKISCDSPAFHRPCDFGLVVFD